MAGAQHDPKLLYAIQGVSAYHIVNGKEESLTPGGPQTLSLLMVPTSSQFADPRHVGSVEDDFYLHLHLPPELDLPLPATTQIYHQPPTSYLIPRWDLGPDSGAFTRIEFPAGGSRKGLQEDIDTFETILAQCTAFLERAQPPKMKRTDSNKAAAMAGVMPEPDSSSSAAASAKAKEAAGEELPAYNPADYKPGEAYAKGSRSSHAPDQGGRIVLVDEEDGSVIGELTDQYQLIEHTGIQPGSKDPVEISFPADGRNIQVQPASQEYVEMEMHPSYKKSSLVSRASKASRLIVTTSDYISKSLQSQADGFTRKTQPVAKPVTFTPAAHERVRRINQFSTRAATMSSTTVGHIGHFAQNLGASMVRKKEGEGSKAFGPDGKPVEGYKPGLLNKSLMAFNTVVDGIEQAGRTLLTGASSSATTVVGHRWGAEAGEMSKNIGGGFKNVGLVYIDVTGVSRRAVLKSVAKGMVVGKVANGGGEVIVGGGDGGSVMLPQDGKEGGSSQPQQQQALPGGSQVHLLGGPAQDTQSIADSSTSTATYYYDAQNSGGKTQPTGPGGPGGKYS